MLIVSQDKLRIFNLEQAPVLEINKAPEHLGSNYHLTMYPLGINLGYYTTEERAKEILREIINKYQEVNTNIKVSMIDVIYNYNEPKVYEMPEK